MRLKLFSFPLLFLGVNTLQCNHLFSFFAPRPTPLFSIVPNVLSILQYRQLTLQPHLFHSFLQIFSVSFQIIYLCSHLWQICHHVLLSSLRLPVLCALSAHQSLIALFCFKFLYTHHTLLVFHPAMRHLWSLLFLWYRFPQPLSSSLSLLVIRPLTSWSLSWPLFLWITMLLTFSLFRLLLSRLLLVSSSTTYISLLTFTNRNGLPVARVLEANPIK